MNIFRHPAIATCSIKYSINQAARTADIDVLAGLSWAKDSGERHTAFCIAAIKVKRATPVGGIKRLCHQGHVCVVAAGIVQDKILAVLLQRGRHGKDWRNANAAGNQDGFGRTFNKREVILRQVDFKDITGFDLLMHIHGPAFAAFLT